MSIISLMFYFCAECATLAIMIKLPDQIATELTTVTYEYVKTRYEMLCRKLGERAVAAGYEEWDIKIEIEESLSDLEHEQYYAWTEDDTDNANTLSPLQRQLKAAEGSILHDSKNYFGGINGYRLSSVEAGDLELVDNPLSDENDSEIILKAAVAYPHGAILTKIEHRFRPTGHPEGPYTAVELPCTQQDVETIKAACVQLDVVRKRLA